MRYSDEFMQYQDGLKVYRDPITIEYGKIIWKQLRRELTLMNEL
jgi:hypothetical protein